MLNAAACQSAFSRRGAWLAILYSLWLLALVGCRAAPTGEGWWTTASGPTAANVAVAAPPSETQQASYESAGASLSSVPDDYVSTQPTFWEKTQQAFSPKNVKRKAKTLVGLGPDEKIAQEHYARGEALFGEQDYPAAAAEFKSAASRWPESPLEEDSLFMRGQSYFFHEQYNLANDTYTNLLKQYENSRHLDTVVSHQFAIARYWDELSRASNWTPNVSDKKRPYFDPAGNAIATYKSVWLNDPTGPLADDAMMAVANAYFVRGNYVDAAEHYDMLRKQFPQSDHQQTAHLLGMRAKLLSYQGPYYDSTPLGEAEELVEALQTQFPTTDPAEKERIAAAAQAIREGHAQRELEVAEYYSRTSYYGAAAQHYRQVIEDYPDTPSAAIARQRLVEIQDKPARPPQRLKWITDALSTYDDE
jgi:outer membrane assembly lipoprotein YfiO